MFGSRVLFCKKKSLATIFYLGILYPENDVIVYSSINGTKIYLKSVKMNLLIWLHFWLSDYDLQ